MVLEFNYCDYVCKYRDGEEYIKDICFSEIGHNRIGSSYFITYYISKVNTVSIKRKAKLNAEKSPI